jgi:hypothetical protein
MTKLYRSVGCNEIRHAAAARCGVMASEDIRYHCLLSDIHSSWSGRGRFTHHALPGQLVVRAVRTTLYNNSLFPQ